MRVDRAPIQYRQSSSDQLVATDLVFGMQRASSFAEMHVGDRATRRARLVIPEGPLVLVVFVPVCVAMARNKQRKRRDTDDEDEDDDKQACTPYVRACVHKSAAATTTCCSPPAWFRTEMFICE